MFAVIGAAGNVGYATSRALRKAGVPVRAILRDATKAAGLEEIGCDIALADLQDAVTLTKAIGDVEALQVIVPLRAQVGDPAGDLRRSIDSLVEALALARPKHVLAISDYGAHVGHDIGMPSIFAELETKLRRLPGRKLILRSAEHMHNWARSIPAALSSGILTSFQDPADMVQPMICAQDLGLISAELLLKPGRETGTKVIHAEGPRRYSALDVAGALGQASGRTVQVEVVSRREWETAMAHMPESLAKLLIKTNDAKNAGGLIDVESNGEVLHGTTDLSDALRRLVRSE